MEDQTETFAKKLGDENLDQSITSISLLEPAAPLCIHKHQLSKKALILPSKSLSCCTMATSMCDLLICVIDEFQMM